MCFSWAVFTVSAETDTFGSDTTHPRIGIYTVSSCFAPRSWNPDCPDGLPSFEGQPAPSEGAFGRLILSRQAVWHAAPEVVPYQPYQALHPYAAQPSHTMLLCTQHIQEVSHDEINPLIILAALNWIPHLRTLFYGAPQKAKRRSGQTWLWAVFMEGSQRCGHQIVSNTLFGVLSLVWWQRWCKAVLKGIS